MKNENTLTLMNRTGFRLDPPPDVLCPEGFSEPEFFKQCCVCKKVKLGASWVSSNAVQHAAVNCSHGYCPDCFRQVLQRIDHAAEGEKYL